LTVRAIRGAIQLDAVDRDAILEGTAELISAVMNRNDLTTDDVISVLFTVTPDLTAEFPALAARKTGFHAVPLMCATEIPVPARGTADGARGHGPAAVRDPACVSAWRGDVAAGHCPMTAWCGGGRGAWGRFQRQSFGTPLGISPALPSLS